MRVDLRTSLPFVVVSVDGFGEGGDADPSSTVLVIEGGDSFGEGGDADTDSLGLLIGPCGMSACRCDQNETSGNYRKTYGQNNDASFHGLFKYCGVFCQIRIAEGDPRVALQGFSQTPEYPHQAGITDCVRSWSGISSCANSRVG